MKVRSIMTDQVISIDQNTGLLEIKDIFDTHDFHHIPVIDENEMVIGMISRLDYHLVLDHFTIFRVDKAAQINDRFLGALIANDIMTRNVATIGPDMEISEASKIFLENLFHALPVMEHRKLIGIITTHDLLKHYSQWLAGQQKIDLPR